MKIIIDERFRRQIPPLSADEYALLEASLKAEGLRDSLIVWKTQEGHVLLDGHNRYEICQRLKIVPHVFDMFFDNREQAEDWIDKNQLGRRNLSPDNFRLIIGRRYERTKKPHGGQVPGSAQNAHTMRTAEAIAEQHGVNQATVRRAGNYYQDIETIKQVAPDIEQKTMAGQGPTVRQAREAAAAVNAGEVDKAVEIIEKKPHVAQNSGENEWYTPAAFIDAARKTMGGIDIDPASSALANRTVKAGIFYTKETDGLKQEWGGRVWMNPPYSQPEVRLFCERFLEMYNTGIMSQGIVLLNNATETKYIQALLKKSRAACFPASRVKFIDMNGNPSGAPLQGQILLYFGGNVKVFIDIFSQFGFAVAFGA